MSLFVSSSVYYAIAAAMDHIPFDQASPPSIDLYPSPRAFGKLKRPKLPLKL